MGVCMGHWLNPQVQGVIRSQSHHSPFPGPDLWASDVGTLSPSFPFPTTFQAKGCLPSPNPSAWGIGGRLHLASKKLGSVCVRACVCVGGRGIVPCRNPTPNFPPFPDALPPAWHYKTGRSPPRHHGYHCLVTGGRRSTGQI